MKFVRMLNDDLRVKITDTHYFLVWLKDPGITIVKRDGDIGDTSDMIEIEEAEFVAAWNNVVQLIKNTVI
jgi:hypothetical protein